MVELAPMTVTSPGDDEGAVPGVPRSSETAERLLRIWPVSDGSERELDAGDLLIDAGEESTLVYLVLEGRLEVVGPSGTVAVLEAGSLVGELGAFTGGARSATVRCAAPARVASISADQFGRLLDEHPELAAEVAGEAARRLRETILAEHLGSLFESAGADLLSRLGEMVEWRHLEAGEVLFEQGDPADSAYLVVSGRLRAEVTEPESSRVIGEAGQGELIGEMALLDDATRGATIYATRESDVAPIAPHRAARDGAEQTRGDARDRPGPVAAQRQVAVTSACTGAHRDRGHRRGRHGRGECLCLRSSRDALVPRFLCPLPE